MQKLTSFLAVAVVAAVACSDAFKPTTESVTGDYQLESFTTDSAGVHKDWVAAGASMEILLTPLGDVIGQLIVPLDTASMLGTWELTEQPSTSRRTPTPSFVTWTGLRAKAISPATGPSGA
jgi:hypothetical protein